MPPQDATGPDETSQGEVEIRQDAAITIQEALTLARDQSFSIGKSTVQRWAKLWEERASVSPVKCVFVTTRTGSFYKLDRDDFQAWLFDQKQNMRPRETLRDPVMSHETQRDPMRSHQTSRDTERPRETSASEPSADATQTLRDENMQLKIDVEVRKQLLNQAAGEITRQRDQIEGLLRENGGLQSRVLQLAAPTNADRSQLPPAADRTLEPHHAHYTQVDNAVPADPPTL